MTAHEPVQEARRNLAALLPHALRRLAELLGSPDPVAAAKARRACARHARRLDAMSRALASVPGSDP